MTDSIIEARRVRFEEWQMGQLVREGYSSDSAHCVMERGLDGRYLCSRVNDSWIGYNAALDSLVIDLPAIAEIVTEGGWLSDTMDADEVIEAIEKAGVKTK